MSNPQFRALVVNEFCIFCRVKKQCSEAVHEVRSAKYEVMGMDGEGFLLIDKY